MKPIRRVAMLSVHTCPLAMLGGKETGGMNVYVRDLSMELVRRGIAVDVFTRSQNPHLPHVMHRLGPLGRVIHIPKGAPSNLNLFRERPQPPVARGIQRSVRVRKECN